MPLSCLPSGLTTISSVSLTVVDDQAELPVVGLEDDDVHRVVAATWRARACSAACEVDERQQVAAQAVDRRPCDPLDAAFGLLAFEADQLEQADLRDGEAVAAAR